MENLPILAAISCLLVGPLFAGWHSSYLLYNWERSKVSRVDKSVYERKSVLFYLSVGVFGVGIYLSHTFNIPETLYNFLIFSVFPLASIGYIAHRISNR